MRETIISIITTAASAGIFGLIWNVFMVFSNKKKLQLRNFQDFLNECDSETQRKCRQTVKHSASITDPDSEDEATNSAKTVIAFYNKWATLFYKGYLPKWTFDAEEGQTLVRMYIKLSEFISARQQKDYSSKYGEQFQKLGKVIKEKNKLE